MRHDRAPYGADRAAGGDTGTAHVGGRAARPAGSMIRAPPAWPPSRSSPALHHTEARSALRGPSYGRGSRARRTAAPRASSLAGSRRRTDRRPRRRRRGRWSRRRSRPVQPDTGRPPKPRFGWSAPPRRRYRDRRRRRRGGAPQHPLHRTAGRRPRVRGDRRSRAPSEPNAVPGRAASTTLDPNGISWVIVSSTARALRSRSRCTSSTNRANGSSARRRQAASRLSRRAAWSWGIELSTKASAIGRRRPGLRRRTGRA